MREICLRQRRVTNQFELRPRNCWARWRWLPPGYNLWASSCRQVIRAAIWEQLIYGPAFSNSKAKPGSVSKIRQWFTTIEPGIWLHRDSSSTLPGVQTALRSFSSEASFKVINFGKLILSLGKSWQRLLRGQSGRSCAINPKHQSATAKFCFFPIKQLGLPWQLAQLVHSSKLLPLEYFHIYWGGIH